ncbi:putative peptide/nitrate transporter [Termitomyces sp. J132]|nr:putative peptide/nitrate transporter [Termitomyces sp. J132]
MGRRPVVLIGTLGMVVATAFFGISTSLAQILLFRSFAGFCSGNVAVVHSVLGELTNSSNQAFAFSIYAIFWPLGAIIGPLIGGSLSNPATKHPQFFNIPFLKTFPYFLPCFVSALLGLVGVILAYFYLDETLPPKCQGIITKGARVPESYGATDTQDAAHSAPPPTSVVGLLSNPVIRALSTSGFALCFIATAFDVVFVLFCYSPIQNGGLSFSVRPLHPFSRRLPMSLIMTPTTHQASQIGYSLATAGAISAGIQLLFLPTLLRTFDTTQFYSFCMGMWPLTFAILPFLNLLARYDFDDVGTGLVPTETRAKIWVGIAIVLGLSRVACLAYSISMILVKEYAPNPASLGSTNGLVQFCMCFARALSPAFVSSVFAYSINKDFLKGHFWVFVMVVISFWGMHEAKNVGRYATVMLGRKE